MACQHKFHDDLHLEKLDFEPVTLVVGTFDPAPPIENPAEWFYGRTDESLFWDVLPRLYGKDPLLSAGAKEWKRFCREERIAITALISSIDDADPSRRDHQRMLSGFADKSFVHNFDEFEYVDIVGLLRTHPTIKNVYLTRGMTELFWRHLWTPVMRYCNQNGLHERKLINPSEEEAAYQHSAYNSEHPGEPIALLQDYLLMRWRQEWHFQK